MQAIQAHHATAPAALGPGASVSDTVSAENSLIVGQLMMQEANAINAETFAGMQGMDNSVSNFDHGVLRGQTPIYAQGMQQPVFWVGQPVISSCDPSKIFEAAAVVWWVL